ncbi:hypothetical protein OSTOST_10241 [Ostertagia ostertagi]
MTMASNSALFMFAFSFCLAGAVAVFVLAVFILLHRLVTDDKYVASKGRVVVIIVCYVVCILLCTLAATVIIISLFGLRQGIQLVLTKHTGDQTLQGFDHSRKRLFKKLNLPIGTSKQVPWPRTR